jgi:hypothetical protein
MSPSTKEFLIYNSGMNFKFDFFQAIEKGEKTRVRVIEEIMQLREGKELTV